MPLIGPFSVGFPVNFSSGGDTTKKAFKKHIDEITRIYGYLNALDAGKVSASDVSGLSGSISGVSSQLTAHINSSTPHPNWKPTLSSLDGNLDVSRITGNWPLSKTSGTLDASKVSGLDAAITAKIPASSGDGITDSTLNTNGYVKFKNGLIIQWGVHKAVSGAWEHSVTFPIPFPNTCYTVVATCFPNEGTAARQYGDDWESDFYINNWNTSGFNAFSHVEDKGATDLTYIAIGK